MKGRIVNTSKGLIRGQAADALRAYTKSSIHPSSPDKFAEHLDYATVTRGPLSYDLSHEGNNAAATVNFQYGDTESRSRLLGLTSYKYPWGPIKFMTPPDGGWTDGSFDTTVDPFEDVDIKYWSHTQKCRIESKSFLDYITDGVRINLDFLQDTYGAALAAAAYTTAKDTELGVTAEQTALFLTKDMVYFDQNRNQTIDFISGPKKWIELLFGGGGRQGFFRGRLVIPDKEDQTIELETLDQRVVTVDEIQAIEATETYTDSIYSTYVLYEDLVENIDDCDYNPFAFNNEINAQFSIETNYQYFVEEYEDSIAKVNDLYSAGQTATSYEISENSLPDANIFQQIKDTYSSPLFIKKDNMMWNHASLYGNIPGDPFSWTSTHFTNITNEHGGEGQVKNLATPSGQGEMFKYLQTWGNLTDNELSAKGLTDAQKHAFYNVGAYSNAFTSDGVFRHAITDHFISNDSDLGIEATPRVFPMYAKLRFNKAHLQDKGTGAPPTPGMMPVEDFSQSDAFENDHIISQYGLGAQQSDAGPSDPSSPLAPGVGGVNKVFNEDNAPGNHPVPEGDMGVFDQGQTLLDFPTAVADKIQELGFTKSILKYLMLATPPNIMVSQIDPATGEPMDPYVVQGEGFYHEGYEMTEQTDFVSDKRSAQSYYEPYNREKDGTRRVWLIDDILGNFSQALKAPAIFDGAYEWDFETVEVPSPAGLPPVPIEVPVVSGKGSATAAPAPEDYESGILDASGKIFCDFFYGNEKQDLGYFESVKEGSPMPGDDGISYYFGGKRSEVDFFNTAFLTTHFAEAKQSLNEFNLYLSNRSKAYCQIYEQKIKFPKKDLRETIAYRVQKMRVRYSNNLSITAEDPVYETVRNMYFLNTSDFDIAEYLDTQVKYGNPVDDDNEVTAYVYKVHAYDLVYSTNYSYSINIPRGEDAASGLNLIENVILAYQEDDWSKMPYDEGELGWFYPGYGDIEANIATQVASAIFGQGGGGPSFEEEDFLAELMEDGDDFVKIAMQGDEDSAFGINMPDLLAAATFIKNNYNPGTSKISQFCARFFAEFEVISRPGLKIVEQPIYQTEPILVASKPPIPPDIEVIPYQGIPDQVLIKISSNSGRQNTPAMPIVSEDVAHIMNTYLAQGMSLDRIKEEQQFYNENGRFKTRLTFENDDHQKKFELFEMNGADHSKVGIEYTDFSSSKVFEGEHSSFFFDKKIVPNRKYYFTCRSYDAHNQISNPSPIYEFEMVQDGEDGFLLPVFKLFKQPVKDKTETKTFKKYISVKPSSNQAVLGEKLFSDEVETIEIKDNVKTFLNKKFKMRLTSKHTGRKIDVNFRFKVNQKGFVENIVTVLEDGSEYKLISGPDTFLHHEQ